MSSKLLVEYVDKIQYDLSVILRHSYNGRTGGVSELFHRYI